MILRCIWCGWKGDVEELDMNERDAPAYCPECGHSTFDIKKEEKHEPGNSDNFEGHFVPAARDHVAELHRDGADTGGGSGI